MTGPDHDRKAEELTVKAHDYLGQGEEQSAAVWAAVAQIHATGPRRCYRARDDGRGRPRLDRGRWYQVLGGSPLDGPVVIQAPESRPSPGRGFRPGGECGLGPAPALAGPGHQQLGGAHGSRAGLLEQDGH